MDKQEKLKQTIVSRQSIIDKLIGRNKKDKKELQAVIDAKAEPEEVFRVGDKFVSNSGAKYLLASISDGTQRVHLANMQTGGSCNGVLQVKDASKITPEELLHLHGIIHVTRYWNQAKQAKVGEKSEQGKSEAKLKDWDYGTTKHGDMRAKIDGKVYGIIGDSRCCGDKIDVIVGNLADDLTKTSEGFVMENGGGYTTLKAETGNTMDNGVRIHHGNHCIVIGGSVLAEFHRKLGHVLNGIRSKK